MFIKSFVKSCSQPFGGCNSSFKMDLLGVGSALGGLFSGISTLASQNSANQANKELAQMNNEFSERMMDKQQQYNIENWERENEYNTPSAQASRFLDAGLNPYLMMSGGSSSVSGSIDGTTPPVSSDVNRQQPLDFSPLGSTFNHFIDVLQQSRKLDIESSLASSEVFKNLSQAEGFSLDNDLKSRVIDSQAIYQVTHNENLTQYEKKHIIAAINRMEWQSKLDEQSYDLTHLKWNDLTNEQKVKNQYYASAAAGNWLDAAIKNRQLPYIVPEKLAQIKQVLSQADLNNALANLNREQATMVSAQILKETFGGQLPKLSQHDWFNLAEGWVSSSDAANRRTVYEYNQLPTDKFVERWSKMMPKVGIGF